jgi:hypothetical protein
MRLVFLHGVAASGKLTTALALQEQIHYPVFHNHLVVDALTTVFPFGSEPFIRLREQFWLQVFADAAQVDRSLTFTFTPEPVSLTACGGPSKAGEVAWSSSGWRSARPNRSSASGRKAAGPSTSWQMYPSSGA